MTASSTRDDLRRIWDKQNKGRFQAMSFRQLALDFPVERPLPAWKPSSLMAARQANQGDS